MEIKGRECKEVKIGKNVFWILDGYKGGDVRKILSFVVDDTTLNMKNLVANMPGILGVVCMRVNEDIEPTSAFVDNLSVNDYLELQGIITEEVTNLFIQEQPKQ
jgi:hypothetical protein